jgi:hypothetical protein
VNEVDLLVLTPAGLVLVEIKSRPGTVEGDATTWRWITEGRPIEVDNPLPLANRKAKRLASVLRRQDAFGRGRIRSAAPWIEPVIFLSAVRQQPQIDQGTKRRVFLRGDRRASRGASTTDRCPSPNRGPGLRARDVGYGNVTGTRHPDHRENTSPWATRTWPVSVPTRALALRSAEILVIPTGLNKRRLWGDLAGSLRGTLNRESGACGLNPRHGRTWRSRLAVVAVVGGAPVRGRHGPCRCQPRSHSAEKRLLISHGRNTMAVRAQSRSTGATGSAAAELAGFMPPNFAGLHRPLLAKRFLKGGDP